MLIEWNEKLQILQIDLEKLLTNRTQHYRKIKILNKKKLCIVVSFSKKQFHKNENESVNKLGVGCCRTFFIFGVNCTVHL